VFFHELVQADVPKDRLIVALSRTLTAAEEDAARAYVAKAGYEVLAGAIPERAAYRDAHNRGEAVTETKGRTHGPVEHLIEALVDKVHVLMVAKRRHAKALRGNERKA
jgi:chromosome partitioning protein